MKMGELRQKENMNNMKLYILDHKNILNCIQIWKQISIERKELQ